MYFEYPQHGKEYFNINQKSNTIIDKLEEQIRAVSK